MEQRRPARSYSTIGIGLKACFGIAAAERSKQIRAHVVKVGLEGEVFMTSVVIDIYVNWGSRKDARNLFEKMPECVEVPWRRHEDVGFVCPRKGEVTRMNGNPFALATACSISAASEQGKQIHVHAIYAGLDSMLSVSSAFVVMSAKCDSIEDSCLVFDDLPEPNLVSSKTTIVANTQHEHGMKVFELFDQMRDYIIFIVVLSVGIVYMVYRGYAYFISINEDYGVTPRIDHCTFMVGLLGRAGQLTDAEALIKEMSFSLHIVVWPTLPGACTIHGNPEFGALMAQHIFELDPQDDVSYGMLSNNYVGVGTLDEAEKVRKLINDRGAIKEAGCSWIKAKDKVHLNVVVNPSIPQMEEMHVKLERLTEELKVAGYMPDTKYMLHIVEMDKECNLNHHSKKLAIAFEFTNISAVIPLKIKIFFHVWVITILPSSLSARLLGEKLF